MTARLARAARALFHWFILAEGSTRTVAILRIGLVALMWTRFSYELTWSRAKDEWFFATSVAFFALSPLYAIGLFTRVVKWAMAAIAAFIPLGLGWWRGHEPWVHHHVAFLCAAVVILAVTPCEKSFSVDRYLLARRLWPRRPPPERGPLYGVRLLCLLVTSLYVFGAYSKMDWSYLSGARNTHHFMERFWGSDLPDVPFFAEIMMGVAISSVVLELALGCLLYVRRLAPALMLAGVVFHVLIYVTLPVSTFTATTCFLYLAFIDPDRFALAIDRMSGRG